MSEKKGGESSSLSPPFFVVHSISFLEFGILAASLIGAMWASNTLVAYPDVRAADLQNNSAVSAAVSTGVVADLLSLTVLAVTTATVVIDADTTTTAETTVSNPSMPVWLAIPILMAFTLWLLPKITEWFFVEVGRTRMQRFVFALAGMAAGASIALLGGIEGLIGAFLAGLGMNRLIPGKGQLMHQIDFVGSTIFIPAFMVSIGLNIDPALLFDIDTLALALLFTGFVLVGKTTAAVITGRMFKFSWNEVGLTSPLSFGQAASTVAIAQVGVGLGLFGQEVVNAAVLAIVPTALITSYETRFFIRMVPRPVPPPAALGNMEDVEVIIRSKPRAEILDIVGPEDLIVAPAYVIHDAAPISTWKVAKSLSSANLAVIAGPHRLSISKGVTRHDIQSVTHPGL